MKLGARGFALAGVFLQGGFGLGQTMFTVSPSNQPKDTDSAATLKLYSELNERLSAVTKEPSSSCLKSYAVYQGCKAGAVPQTCDAAPQCTVTAALPQLDLMNVRLEFPPDQDAAVLVPQPVMTTNGAPSTIKMIKMNPAPSTKTDAGNTAPGSGLVGIFGTSAAQPPSGAVNGAAAGVRLSGQVRISGGVMQGLRLTSRQPLYPPVAKITRLSGTVVLMAIVSKTGTMKSLQVSSASSPVFVNSAIDAVRHWTYRPYLLNGEPAEVLTTVTVNFTLGTPPMPGQENVRPPE